MRKNSRIGLALTLSFGLGCATLFHPCPALASEEEAAAKPAEVSMFVKMNPINVPIIRKNGTTSILAIDVVAQCKDEKSKDKVEAAKPILRDTFIRALYGNIETNKLVLADGSLDMERVKQRLLKGSQFVMKEDAVIDILFNNVSHRAF